MHLTGTRPMTITSRSHSGSASMTPKTFSPNARTSLQALTGLMPRLRSRWHG